ncbi:phytoene desaturase family protein [Methanobacterium alcaliphilum]|uniref:phytoene desaturase family protein n=1 Tax=Methanobacterium alcaliphilum TaxID=392018 RepID=UPI00200B8A23|nr:NAD(P)/FAD-dependent oxidoreductase [Methanobacterium alcaliphilum]MCK9151401.1 NAD(P)/FAD-dependent oxidoreductase [Methanobacterium alcaliphilum]
MDNYNYDVIVIGAGISGLLSALALSKEGKSVLILEKEEDIGGVCRSYEFDGYRIDTGPHAITRLENGPFKELMDNYFDVIPQFVPFGKYHVRIGNEIKPFPWNLNSWLKFGLIPKTDRLLIMKALFNTLYLLNAGKSLSDISMKELLPENISITTRRFVDWLCYFLVGTSIENTAVSRFIDNKTHKSSSIKYIGNLYDLFVTEGAKDQGYPKGGLQSIINSILISFPKNVQIKTREEVVKIQCSHQVEKVVTNKNEYCCENVIYSGFASDLPKLVDNLPEDYARNLNQIQKVNSLTIWLGLNKQIFKNYGSEMWIDSDPYAWMVPISNYDPALAPEGKQLVGFAFTLPDDYDVEAIRKKALDSIINIQPEIKNHIEMVHYQDLIPEKAAWSINSGFGDVETPINNLYCVGTDTEKRSAGVSRAAYSVLRCLEMMKSDGNLGSFFLNKEFKIPAK